MSDIVQKPITLKLILTVLPILIAVVSIILAFGDVRADTNTNTKRIESVEIRLDKVESIKEDISAIRTDIKWLKENRR